VFTVDLRSEFCLSSDILSDKKRVLVSNVFIWTLYLLQDVRVTNVLAVVCKCLVRMVVNKWIFLLQVKLGNVCYFVSLLCAI